MPSPRPFIRKIAITRNESDSTSFVSLCARVATGEKIIIELPPSKISNLRQFERTLENLAVVLPLAGRERKAFLKEVASSRPRKTQTRASQAGWRKDCDAYVLQTKVIGPSNLVGLSIPSDDERGRGWLASSGTLNGWKENVATAALGSSYAMLSIAAAFASPLLALIKQSSFSICISGRTRSGKTVATLMGGSVIGLGTQEGLLTWNNTEAGFNETLTRFRDCLCPVDDFESMTGSNADRYQRIRNLSYTVGTGSEKGRHSKSSLSSKQWRSIILTSMERPVRELAQNVGQTRQGGETIRTIDLPIAPSSQTRPHIFDRAEADGTPITQRWMQKTFRRIIDACAEHHGIVFERYVASLCADKEVAHSKAQSDIQTFVKAVALPHDGPEVNELARLFGLLFAGGGLAIRYDLLPWRRSELLSAMTKCYVAARDILPDEGVIFRDGKQRLLDFIDTLPSSRKTTDYKKLKGYQYRSGSERNCMIRVSAFNAAFTSRKQRELVIASLQRSGRIKMSDATADRSQAAYQHTWPDLSRRRSYLLTLPVRPTGN